MTDADLWAFGQLDSFAEYRVTGRYDKEVLVTVESNLCHPALW